MQGTCSGLGKYRFFSAPAPCKRLVDSQILLPVSKRVMSTNTTSLVIVGAKPDQHVGDHFYGMGVKHMTIVENDPFMADKIGEYLKTSKLAKKISLIPTDANRLYYGGYTHIDLDLMNSAKKQAELILRALQEQASANSRMKSFVFTQGIRKAGGHEAIFKYINSVIEILGASLEGFNGEKGGCRKGTRLTKKLGARIYCRENVPNFSFIGNRLKELKCYSYRDDKHSGMITTMLLYR